LKTSQTSKTPPRALALPACAALFFAASVLDCRAQQPATTSNTQTTQAASASAAGDTTARAADANKSERAADYITGRVVGEGGEPLGGVNVYANPRSSAPVIGTRHVAVADDDGAFRIRGLEPGIYTVSAFVPGYVPEPDPVTGRVGGEYKPGDAANVRLVRGGVITGAITDAQGQAVVAVGVRAFRVRDLDGRVTPPYLIGGSMGRTDDRGVYRIYGLQPGVYVVVAGGAAANNFGVVSPYQTDVPTFYPSSTRDTAAEVTVRAGQESAGVDIRYREEQGHRVTGRVELAAPPTDANATTGLTLSYASSGVVAGSTFVNPSAPDSSFSFESVADGDYDLQATSGGRDGLTSAAPPLRVTVRGADVVGLRVMLTPLASASGTVLVERAGQEVRARAECKDARAPLPPQETLVAVAFDRPASARPQPIPRVSPVREAEPDEAGVFTLRSLEPGRYHLIARPFDENLYVRSIDVPATTPNAQRDAATSNAQRGDSAPARQQRAPSAAAQAQSASAQAARVLLDLKSGQQLKGITVRLSEGAAALSGRVAAAEGAPAPPYASLRVHLLPAEREHAEDALRFFETTANADGSFSFKSLPPGRYLLLARPLADPNDPLPRPAAWDADSRAKLRAEAEAAGTTVELQPCQRTNDFALRFPPSAPK
jgi:protocatechuate 3,4-dioxygenase beta subunit